MERTKSLNLFSRLFSARGAAAVLDKIVSSCQLCLLNNVAAARPLLQAPRLSLSRPRQMWYCDVCQYLSQGESVAWLVCVDGFSLFTVTYRVIKPETSGQIARLILDLFAMQGAPYGICTDNASTMKALLSQALALLGVKQYLISPRRPRANLAERLNKALLRIMALLHQSLHLSDELLVIASGLAAHLWNRTPVSSLGFVSPFKIHFGCEPTADLLLPSRPAATGGKGQKYHEFITALSAAQILLFRAVAAIRARREQKRLEANPPAGPEGLRHRFSIGDFVLLKREPDQTKLNHKLRPRYDSTPLLVVKHGSQKLALNYVLLPMDSRNLVTYGFRRDAVLPKSRLIIVKENRLKLVSNTSVIPLIDHTLSLRLATILLQVLKDESPLPTDFQRVSAGQLILPANSRLQALIKQTIGSPGQPPEEAAKAMLKDSIFGMLPQEPADREDQQMGSQPDPSLQLNGPDNSSFIIRGRDPGLIPIFLEPCQINRPRRPPPSSVSSAPLAQAARPRLHWDPGPPRQEWPAPGQQPPPRRAGAGPGAGPRGGPPPPPGAPPRPPGAPPYPGDGAPGPAYRPRGPGPSRAAGGASPPGPQGGWKAGPGTSGGQPDCRAPPFLPASTRHPPLPGEPEDPVNMKAGPATQAPQLGEASGLRAQAAAFRPQVPQPGRAGEGQPSLPTHLDQLQEREEEVRLPSSSEESYQTMSSGCQLTWDHFPVVPEVAGQTHLPDWFIAEQEGPPPQATGPGSLSDDRLRAAGFVAEQVDDGQERPADQPPPLPSRRAQATGPPPPAKGPRPPAARAPSARRASVAASAAIQLSQKKGSHKS